MYCSARQAGGPRRRTGTERPRTRLLLGFPRTGKPPAPPGTPARTQGFCFGYMLGRGFPGWFDWSGLLWLVVARRLVGTCQRTIVDETLRLLEDSDVYRSMAHAHNPYGDGKSSARVADILAEISIDDTLLIKDITY